MCQGNLQPAISFSNKMICLVYDNGAFHTHQVINKIYTILAL